ncbi:glycosyltransferase family 2 protein [Marinilactibacillus psychrotolerans]|uniref:Glycosyltransferase family 2 protein n=1 Tax=Marinilactibacillus psychrotolerans TaxID=191770 RepID=A0A5R9C0Q0_9LACT|nr:glycosyltransferase family 2 protein [Marinilactibacillus psychrotolerans]TLQ06265.1 glycosyltransferase family 2 protein [Marinilactibacillus psychrotolerans]
MSQPFFSIVMPAYNAQHSIGMTIDSILQQEWSDYELIIINDGSKDATEKIIRSYIEKDQRIKSQTIENNGPGNARNLGIKMATGKYLYLMDSDDGLPQGALKQYAQILVNDQPDLIISSYLLNVMDNAEIIETKYVKAPNIFFKTNKEFLFNLYPLMNKQLMYVIWNKVYRMDIIKDKKIVFPQYSSCEDRLFNIRYFHYAEKVKVIDKELYQYSFDGKASLTNRFLPNKFETFVEFYKELKELVSTDLDGFSALFLKGVMSCIIPIHSKDCPFSFKEKLAYIKKVVNHPEVVKAVEISKKDTAIRRVIFMLFSMRSSILIYANSKIMYGVSNASPKLIEKLKGNF